ncbi:MAG: cellobiose phosphorylase, partial [Vallitaleaceae bacterium]|nr:cellobiose phosphorylase [Vallitaleaceae bacterium]
MVFLDSKGTFQVNNPQAYSHTYFPLCNNYGMKSAITPWLGGDMKTDQHHFFLAPVTQEELHHSGEGRNLWLQVHGEEPYSLSGNSALQRMKKDEVILRAGFLWHQLELQHQGLRSEVTSFVPANEEWSELHRVCLTNERDTAVEVDFWIAVPMYGRSADNVRDHRHVTALLNRAMVVEGGIVSQATLSFDERGHKKNEMSYHLYSSCKNGALADKYYPILEDFMGEGGSLDWPNPKASGHRIGDEVEGYELMGAIGYSKIRIEPGASMEWYFVLHMTDSLKPLSEPFGKIAEESYRNALLERYLNAEGFESALKENQAWWEKKLGQLEFFGGNYEYNQWLKWVTLQPILRRIYGCSFLPHHDYGRGGRGWRDLWQDCLALILMEPEGVRELLYNNFAGVRMDGTNATIIGAAPGEFKADRNNIVRVWMDHGLWPWMTVELYVQRSGDWKFLLEEQVYFKDRNHFYGKGKDQAFDETEGTLQKDGQDRIHQGTILEHILIQNLTSCLNLGEHGMIRLEGADWNDGLDMARERGESVAFTAAYIGNLLNLSKILKRLKQEGIEELSFSVEVVNFIETLDLQAYFQECLGKVSGLKKKLRTDFVMEVLGTLATERKKLLLEQEWIQLSEKLGFFRGYYDNDGKPLEGLQGEKVDMTLTGQVFVLLSNLVDEQRGKQMQAAAKEHLFEKEVGGYRLNTNFHEVKLNMGRLFGFAYGHKENGAMFSHMAVMFANGLLRTGLAEEGFEVLNTMYQHASDMEKSKIYPGVPEYVDARGRGMYHYLTGAASWYLLTMVNEVFGIKGDWGDLHICPKLPQEMFDEKGNCAIRTIFAQIPCVIHFQKQIGGAVGQKAIISELLSGENLATA